MIQRIQTVYLFLAVVCCVVCLVMPIGKLASDTMMPPQDIYNACIVANGSGALNVNSGLFIALFALLVLTAALAFVAIFSYKKRMRQAKMCASAMFLIVLWHALLVFIAFTQVPEGAQFKPMFGTCLPFVALVFLTLARRSIIKDEKLVRAADRIRD